MALTQFKYGGHAHPVSEVHLVRHEVIPMTSERGERMATLHRLHLAGELLASTQAGLLTAADALITAYADDYRDAGLYLDDGTATNHVIVSQNTISGVHVEHRSWPSNDPAELATHRSFYIVLRALIDDQTSQIIHYHENLQFVGEGSPRWEWVRLPTGQAVKQDLVQATTQQIIQSGRIVGWTLYPIGNVPPPLFPNYEHRDVRQMYWQSPKWMGNAYRGYGVSWRYFMEAPLGQSAVPNLY